jgi:RNA polymerase sigma-70 factor (ECF subfamily)
MPHKPDPLEARFPVDDLELARRCARGDEEAQRIFVNRLGSLVYSLCARSGLTPPDCDDVSQQIMLDAFRALPSYRGTSRLSTWVYSLALRRVSDYFRSSQRREVALGSPGDATFPAVAATADRSDPDCQALQRDVDKRVNRAVARLPEPERHVVMAYYLGEMSVAEIARLLAIPEGTVKTRLHRARGLLRKELGEL